MIYHILPFLHYQGYSQIKQVNDFRSLSNTFLHYFQCQHYIEVACTNDIHSELIILVKIYILLLFNCEYYLSLFKDIYSHNGTGNYNRNVCFCYHNCIHICTHIRTYNRWIEYVVSSLHERVHVWAHMLHDQSIQPSPV